MSLHYQFQEQPQPAPVLSVDNNQELLNGDNDISRLNLEDSKAELETVPINNQNVISPVMEEVRRK